jgi:hypothetical protein
MSPPNPGIRTLEVHPFPLIRQPYRYCSSGHPERDGLGVPLFVQAIGDAADLGYSCVNIAGDQPLHCPGLHSLCEEAHSGGMTTSLELKQAAMTERLLDELHGSVDLVRMAPDGRPEFQGRVRKCYPLILAWERGIGVDLIFRLTRRNTQDMEWAAQFAMEHGVRALLVRPVDLDADGLAAGWMTMEYLRDVYRRRLRIDFETPNRYSLAASTTGVLQWQRDLSAGTATLGEVVSPMVIDGEGVVRPVRRGFPDEFSIADLRCRRLRDAAAWWTAQHSARFAAVYVKAIARAQSDGAGSLDFFDLLSEEAGRIPVAALATAG